MAKWIFLKTVILILLSLTASHGQSPKKSNPFEIISRMDSVKNAERDAPVTSGSVKVQSSSDDQNSGQADTLNAIKAAGSQATQTIDPKRNPFDVDHVPLRKSTLSSNEMGKDFNTEIIQSTHKSNNFLIWFLILSGALLAIVINAKNNIIQLIYKSIFNENILKLFYREESTRFSSYIFLLYIIFGLSISSYLYLLINRFSDLKGLSIWFYILAIVAMVYFVRHLSLLFLGNIFGINKNTGIYSFTIMLFNLFIGLVLIPINLVIAFGPELLSTGMVYFSVIFLLILILLRTFRGVFIISEYINDRMFQIFIYLCAFEIAPVLILIKTAVKVVL